MKMLVLHCVMAAVLVGAYQARPRIAPERAPSDLEIAAAKEPGPRLRVELQIVGPDGKPIPRASVYVYQTDARGYYTPEDARADRNARLHGWLRSDAEGRILVRTVRPGSYPGTRNPEHVHFIVNATGLAERVFEIVFDDDPLVVGQVRDLAVRQANGFMLCKPQRNAEVQLCRQVVRL